MSCRSSPNLDTTYYLLQYISSNRQLLSKWVSGAEVVIGAVTIYAGLEVAYLGFGGLTTVIGISMIIYFIWVGILGVLMLRKSTESQ